jgi:glucosamine kinase
MYVAGIDGGGTHSRAVLVDQHGEIRARARGGCGNFQNLGLDGLEVLLDQLLSELGWKAGDGPLFLCLALAGAGRAEEQEAIAGLVRARGWATGVQVVSDARAALEGAHGGAPGLILIAGTGSIAMGKNNAGQVARAGGWGPLLGDEGSGYRIGLEALRAVLRARDGWGEGTVLDGMLQQELGLRNWDEIVRRVYQGDLVRSRIAALAPRVFAAARDGDGVAREIIAAAGAALGRLAGALARRLGMTGAVDLACTGGVFRERETLRPAMAAAAGRESGAWRWREPLLPPALGAVLLAWLLSGQTVDRGLIAKLARSREEKQ